MCKFKSGIILKNNVILAPMYNESHSLLLRKIGIDDTDFNARKVFVRVELVPPEKDILSNVSSWEYIVDQDILPDWYENDAEKYEKDFREAVKEWKDKNIFDICGVPCTKLKEENGCTYYHVCTPLYDTEFGTNNYYPTSELRRGVLNSNFAKLLLEEFGDRLVPISIDLTSMDGLKDYGSSNGDLISIPTIDLYRECRENILCGSKWWWLSTPGSTPSNISELGIIIVLGDTGSIGWNTYRFCNGVRPFFILKS